MTPESWKIIEFCGIPKEHKAALLESFRWIGKLDCCSKWYARSLSSLIRPSLRPLTVRTYGFRRGGRCDDLVGIARQCVFIASRWNRPLVVGSADIATAFDSMKHQLISNALLCRGAHPYLVRAVLRELHSIQARIEIPGAGATDLFQFSRGGKQGGTETPDILTLSLSMRLRSPLANGEQTDSDSSWEMMTATRTR